MISAIYAEVRDTPSNSAAMVIKIGMEAIAVASNHPVRSKVRQAHDFFYYATRAFYPSTTRGHLVSAIAQRGNMHRVGAASQRCRTKSNREWGSGEVLLEPMFPHFCTAPGKPQRLRADKEVTRNHQISPTQQQCTHCYREEQGHEQQGSN